MQKYSEGCIFTLLWQCFEIYSFGGFTTRFRKSIALFVVFQAIY